MKKELKGLNLKRVIDMSLTQTILSSLQKNLVNGAGFYRSPNGVFEATWLPDERTGYIDIRNPGSLDFKSLKAIALKYLKSLPKGKWEFNPDTPQKGKIYGQRIFKGVKGVTPNPTMPNNALTYNNTGTATGSGSKGTIMKVNKATPKPSSNLKVGAGGGNTFSKQLDAPGKFGMADEAFNHLQLDQFHKIVTPTGVMPRA